MFFKSLIDLLYPHLCIGCNQGLQAHEQHLCTSCLYHLPQTHFHRIRENPVEKIFWGRCSVERAYAYIYFKKEGIGQKILHQLKYKGNQELATFLGNTYGNQLKQLDSLPDAVVAVPLHKSKLRKRGYNQSACFAQGIAEALTIPDLSYAVGKKTATETQTRKSRFDRWMNVSEVFTVEDAAVLENRHLLVCDDVITTGATLEALIKCLPATCKISVCAIALPVKG